MELGDLTEGKDFARGTSEVTTQFTSSYVSFATTGAFTPDNASDDWLVLAGGFHTVDGVSAQTGWRINRDADTEVLPQSQMEGEDAAETKCTGLSRVFSLTAAAHTFIMQATDAGEVDNHAYSDIFALRLNAFADHNFKYKADYNPSTTEFEEMETFDITPTATGDFIFFGTAVHDPDAASGRNAKIRIQSDGTSIPTGYDAHLAGRNNDELDEVPNFCMVKASLSSGAARTIDIDGEVQNASSNWVSVILAAFSVALAGAAVDLIEPPLLHTFALTRAASY